MLKKASFIRTSVWAYAVCSLMFIAGSAVAAPSGLHASGTFSHKGTVTISGTGFGTKGTAAPVVWDDASGNNILDKWDGAWPNNNSAYNITYRSPMRGIGTAPQQ